MIKSELITKLDNKSATIGIIGLGYVGLPLMMRYVDVGYKVIGFDIDEGKIKYLQQGKSYIKHITINKPMAATSDFSKAAEVDALILCVPTPLNKHREPDLSFVIDTFESLLPYIKKGQIISLESTTYPGTTDEELKTRLESVGFVVGKDVFLVFSPEREDPANPDFTVNTIPKICGGCTKDCLGVGIALYSQIINKIVPVSSAKVAEMTKLLENIHRAVNIGLVNEMKMVADRMGIDIYEVIRAAATKPFGFVPYYPGPGLGGHCIPIDPFYLTWKAREYGVHTRFIELAGEINSAMPSWVVNKIIIGLNKCGKAINGSRILVLGLAYKKNIDDVRESPAVAVMELLQQSGAIIDYSDPYISVFPAMRKHHFDLKSVPLSANVIKTYDCIILITAHDDFDYDMIIKNAKLIVDTRGIYSLLSHDNLIAA